MMNELQFYEIDLAALGSDTEDDGGDKDDKVVDNLLRGGIDDEDGPGESLLLKTFNNMRLDRDELGDSKRKFYDEEMNIQDYEVEVEAEECMTDWYRKPYAETHEIKAAKQMSNDHVMPVVYYDNDDGFWDTYIQFK